MSNQQYVDLKINGKLFPTWVLENFREYRLESFSKEELNKISGQLRSYQKFITEFMSFESPYREMLVYHGLGTGKSSTSLNVYNALFARSKKWNVYLLIKSSLEGNWRKEIDKWLKGNDYVEKYSNIQIIFYNAPNVETKFTEAVNTADPLKASIFIIDEVHRFIQNVYSNIAGAKSNRVLNVYRQIVKEKRSKADTRILLLSGTPMISSPFELALLFNMLRPGTFPDRQNEFNRLYVENIPYETINLSTKNMFQRRILGLVSYYSGYNPALYATKKIQRVEVDMSKYHRKIYEHFEELERKMVMGEDRITKAKQPGPVMPNMRSFTRQASNFVFPDISGKVNALNRPRPKQFGISTKLSQQIMKKRAVEMKEKVSKYQAALKNHVDTFRSYVMNLSSSRSLQDDVKEFLEKYDGDIDKFFDPSIKKSEKFDVLYDCSSKFMTIMLNIMKSPGSVMIFSSYVRMEGLEVFKIYLEAFGITAFTSKDSTSQFGEFHSDVPNKNEILNVFNSRENMYGKVIKAILISPSGSEGISLANVRQVHIMEPYWNYSVTEQAIGRAFRLGSHLMLPEKDRTVNVYLYASIIAGREKETTDEYIAKLEKAKKKSVDSFLRVIKEAAVDCKLYEKHHEEENYPCFQFAEETLLGDDIGPAYKKNEREDRKYDDGLDAKNSVLQRVKVIRIKAVHPKGKDEYTKPKEYWYDPTSRVVYDFQMHFPVGKIGSTNEDLPLKLDEDIYIMDKVIPIPRIKS